MQACKLAECNGHISVTDWAQNVICRADCNAYVKSQKDSVWKPTLVILRISHAATFVMWFPLRSKLAAEVGAFLFVTLSLK